MTAPCRNTQVKCWGDEYIIGHGGDMIMYTSTVGDHPDEMGDNLPYVDVGTVKAITAAAYQTCAILDDDTVKCW